jgi:flagellar L-ring protein precursor FlgH
VRLSAFVWTLFVWVSVAPSAAHAINLYQDDAYRPLTGDRRGQRVGDVITVQVIENSSAAASAGTQTEKSNDGAIKQTTPNRQRGYSLGLSENFDGNGKISRTGRLLAQLSVTVVAVEPNGDLRIKGDQNLEINGEKQAISLEGRVRPIDVSETNTVVSSRISEAKITYIGDGVLAESQHKGWLSKVLSFLGLI